MDETDELARDAIDAFRARGWTLATAESCTGGMIAGAVTAIAGSSAVFDCGFVTYSNEAKQRMIGVRETTLAAHGAVSRETALEMAEGARDRSGATVAVSVTGIAGPDGGSAEKPVGLVHMAIATAGGTHHHEFRFGDIGRAHVRAATVRAALAVLAGLAQVEVVPE